MPRRSASEASHRGVCAWLFLAPSQLPSRAVYAENQSTLLGAEAGTKRPARRRPFRVLAETELEAAGNMGVRNEKSRGARRKTRAEVRTANGTPVCPATLFGPDLQQPRADAGTERKKQVKRTKKSVAKRSRAHPQLFDGCDPFAVFDGWIQAIEGKADAVGFLAAPLPAAEAAGVKWLNCGMVWNHKVISTTGPEGPGRPLDSSMLDLLETGDIGAAYFLSPNAATGMLRRADRMERKFLPALRQALERLKAQGDKASRSSSRQA